MENQPTRPSWDALFECAVGQAGLFTTKQAAEAGYSPQLLAHHLRSGRVVRVQRGMYRLVHYPLDDYEWYHRAWLWSENQGVLSHETALSMHQLSDVLPFHTHLTLPLAWKRRRLRVPEGYILHFADLRADEREWHCVPITTPRRTLSDCAADHLSPEFLEQALHQALERRLVTLEEVPDVQLALKPYMAPA